MDSLNILDWLLKSATDDRLFPRLRSDSQSPLHLSPRFPIRPGHFNVKRRPTNPCRAGYRSGFLSPAASRRPVASSRGPWAWSGRTFCSRCGNLARHPTRDRPVERLCTPWRRRATRGVHGNETFSLGPCCSYRTAGKKVNWSHF
jgi:hypothetical protein